jgi:N-acetylglucosaminyldiphosphoundecaprenol N-acetyl-beta-D-mannosaminyltransferase
MKPLDSLLIGMPDRLVESRSDLLASASEGRPIRIHTVNLHHLYLASKDSSFYALISKADLVSADGWPVSWALGEPDAGRSVARVTGADFVEDLVDPKHTKGLKIALIGASPDAGRAFESIATTAGNVVVFREHGLVADWNLRAIAAELNRLDCQLALVAVTPPNGDRVAAALLDEGFTGTTIAIGGAIDMVVGQTKRAPRVMIALRLEWAHRMLKEPKRLFVRYVLECMPLFATKIVPFKVRTHRRRLNRP